MPDINTKYEKLHLRNISATAGRIKLLFDELIVEVAYYATFIRYNGGIFSLDRFPFLKEKIEELLTRLHGSITIELVNSIQQSWDLSNQKNNTIVDKRLAGKTPSESARQRLYDPNVSARDSFIKRKEKGLNLSQRVWKSIEPFKTELERGLAVGISEGQPAAEMAKNLKRFLNEPDRLFRKVRNLKGDLVLSKAAQDYRPGAGIYRSSIKNALRLTRNEVGAAYREADFQRWQSLPFVVGMRTQLSNRHPVYDLCDVMAQKIFPKDFKWSGAWHVNCLCSQVPVMISASDYDKYEDYILGITDQKPTIPVVKTLPPEFNEWVKDNAERIGGWKNKPRWITDNPRYVKELLKK